MAFASTGNSIFFQREPGQSLPPRRRPVLRGQWRHRERPRREQRQRCRLERPAELPCPDGRTDELGRHHRSGHVPEPGLDSRSASSSSRTPSCNITGNGEGKTFLGATDVTTDSTGAASIAATVNPSTAGRSRDRHGRPTARPRRHLRILRLPVDRREGRAARARSGPAVGPVAAQAEAPGGGGTGGGGRGGGGGGGGTTPDTKAPLLDLGGEGKQSKDDKVKVEVSCDEACTVDATGTIKVPEDQERQGEGQGEVRPEGRR